MRKCRGCGADVPDNAPFGHCPRCLLELGFDPLPNAAEEVSPLATAKGRRFGDYELLEQIGRGGMGIIYKARQVTLNRLVALKMIRAVEFASPTLVQRFHLEAEAAANLHHPNIVSIYETGEHKGEHFFSMGLVDGFGLDRHITSAGFCIEKEGVEGKAAVRTRQEQIARIVAKISRAVDYAHQHGVLHRDLKPSNVLLDRQREPHLTDFGVAKVISQAGISLTASGAIVGTPSYMAPEQAAGQSKRATTAADVYSLGAILYEMLTGQPPFRAATPVETLKQVVKQEPKHPTTFREGVDGDLATISMKCLEKEPQRRYPSASALAEDLERWLRREPIEAQPVGPLGRVHRWCQREPVLAALGAVIMLCLAAATLASMLAVKHAAALTAAEKQRREEVENAALRIKELHYSQEIASDGLRQEVLDNLSELFTNKGTESIVISSRTRRALFGRPPVAGPSRELTFVEHIYEHPTNMLTAVSPILDELEARSQRSNMPVAIRIHLFKTPSGSYQAMESDQSNIGRMGSASFLHLHDRSSGVSLLAMQNQTKPLTLALFARTNSPVARLAASRTNIPLFELMTNRSLALTHAYSATGNFLPKRLLIINGIYATNLSGYEHLGGQRLVFDAVLAGKFDVGAGNMELLGKYPALQVLAKFEVPNLGRCWVAGKGLDAVIARHLQACLLQLKDPAILGKLESQVSGFKKVTLEAMENLRKMIREAAPFDSDKD